ncbi:MAG: flagellar basal-body rod protein FlgF [candidate division Zixibacteria bacterium 4484_95]|nr:MAG: flagellar basal-body rod protein FlgF [candidate division Zixibacteria bacterium 4484_95]
MIKGIYTSASGMIPRTLKQEVFANNMANANTIGFKKDRVFLHQLRRAKNGLMTDLKWEVPMVDGVYIDFSQGFTRQTERPLDVAIEGNGFFVVSTPEGERYTRDGEFSLTQEGVLVNKNGHPVLSDSGPITITGDDISISADGIISVDGSELAKIRIVDFDKPYNLTRVNYGYMALANEEIQAVNAEGYKVRQGYIEESNVNIIEQMVDMLVSFRAYEAGQKSIQAQDETLDKAVNDLGRVR